jgi:HPt (histidine-containing phosphotransfer) domain-containing protein
VAPLLLPQAKRGEMEKFVVHIDPDLSDLMPGFLTRKRDDARTILSAICCSHIDFEELARLGHKIKGEGGSFGLDAISTYGAEIEQAARNHDAEAIRHLAGELALYLASVQIEYD